MISEDHLKALALAWFQDSGWEHRFGPDIAPEVCGIEETMDA